MRGLVLDMDGTLVHSEPLSMQAWNTLFEQQGVPPLQPAAFERFVGVSSVETARIILTEHAAATGQQPPDSDVVMALTNAKRTLLVETIQQLSISEVDALWFDGVRELLAKLHAAGTVKLALCTSSDNDQVQVLVDREPQQVGSQVLSVRVTRDDVAPDQMKPAPTPYLQASQLLGLRPDECTAVEDSPSGVRSAVAAKYEHVFGVCSTIAEDDSDGLERQRENLLAVGATHVFQNTTLALQWVLEQAK